MNKTPFRPHLLFGAYTACLLALNGRALAALVDLSMRDATASHLVLVPFVTLALIVRGRRAIFSSGRAPSIVAIGALLVGVAGASLGVEPWSSRGGDSLSLAIAVMVVLWLGGFLVLYGPAAFSAALFPLLFLVFMVPIPSALLAGATAFLKRGSTEVVAGLFTVLGTPFHREGFVFELPKFAIEVADQCSGIRSSIALLLTTLLAGHMFLTTGWKKALLVAIIIPLAVLKNGIRIVSLSLLGTYVDESFITGALHHEGGVVFYLIALVILMPFLSLLRNSEKLALREA